MIYNPEIHQMSGKNNPDKVLKYKKDLSDAFLDYLPEIISEKIYERAYDDCNGCYSDLEGNYEELATIANLAFSLGRKDH